MENLNDLSGNNTLDTPPEKQDVSHLFSKSISDKKVVNHRRTVLSKKNSNKLMVNELLAKKPKPVSSHPNPLRAPMPPTNAVKKQNTILPPKPIANLANTTTRSKMKTLPVSQIQKPTGKKEIVFIIRGHIRDSFDNGSPLRDFIKLLINKYNVTIYIHTWTNKECKKTWRHEASMYSWKKTPEQLKVTEELVADYFKEFKPLIKKITLEEEENVKLCGRTDGQLTNICTMPTKSWKYFLHNLYVSLTKVNPEDRNKTIFSMRFDMIQKRLFSTWHGFDHNKMLESYFKICTSYIERSNLKYKWCKMQSIGGSSAGYDNALLGDFRFMEKLFHMLELKLDTVLVKCHEQCDSRNQEIFVERLRDKLIHNIDHFDFIFKEN